MKRPHDRKDDMPAFVEGRGCFIIPVNRHRRRRKRPPLFPFAAPFAARHNYRIADRPAPVHVQDMAEGRGCSLIPAEHHKKHR